MTAHPRSAPGRAASLALALLALAPLPARALPLLDRELALGSAGDAPSLAVVLAADEEGPSLDFDLLEPPPPVAPVDDGSMRWRRRLLRTHQGVGLGLVALQLATTVVGQLNYSDKYNGGVTGRYEATHTVLAYSTLGVFAVNGTLALLAPRAKGKTSRGFDRVSLHKLGMLTATAGMLAQAGLGIYTDRREGYLNQEKYAKAHLAIGYATLAAVGVAVGALVF
jgi:hypothetical protein